MNEGANTVREANGAHSPARARREQKRLADRVTATENRLDIVEAALADIGDIKDGITKIAKYIKLAVPSIISAAIAAGVVNGKLGAFLRALFGG